MSNWKPNPPAWQFPPKKLPYINDIKLYYKWIAISKKLTTPIYDVRVTNQNMLLINNQVLIAKSKPKMRLISQLDWVAYDVDDLAQALDAGQADVYYEQQMQDIRSDPNVWKRHDEEMDLKTYYATRAGRASNI